MNEKNTYHCKKTMKSKKFYNNDWIGNDIRNKLKECKIKYE